MRQLENALFRAVVLADGDELTVAEFPQIAAHVEGFDVRVPALPAPLAAAAMPQREIVPRRSARSQRAAPCLATERQCAPARRHRGRSHSLRAGHYRGQMSEMARRLGIGRSTLYRKMKDFGLQNDENGDPESNAAA